MGSEDMMQISKQTQVGNYSPQTTNTNKAITCDGKFIGGNNYGTHLDERQGVFLIYKMNIGPK